MAYFVELDRLNNKEVLYSILSDFGWESNKVDAVINDKEIATKVQQQIAHSQKIGVTGVPYFIINNKYAISGAQPSSVFLEAFNKLSSIESIIEGDSCDTSTGDC
jgi:predicted DsbA family dithiol-disulfide isomerase